MLGRVSSLIIDFCFYTLILLVCRVIGSETFRRRMDGYLLNSYIYIYISSIA